MDEQPKPQIDKFKDMARELECDDDEKTFDETLKRIAKMPRPKARTTTE